MKIFLLRLDSYHLEVMLRSLGAPKVRPRSNLATTSFKWGETTKGSISHHNMCCDAQYLRSAFAS